MSLPVGVVVSIAWSRTLSPTPWRPVQRASAETRKVAIGQLIMHGRQHLVGIKALKGGLMFSILRYADELRDPKPYFENINAELNTEAVGLAKELVEAESGKFEPQKIPDKYAETLRELLRAKVEQRAPQIEVAPQGKAPKEVINIMAALKESMQAKGRAKVQDAVRRRMGKPSEEEKPRPRASRPTARRTAHWARGAVSEAAFAYAGPKPIDAGRSKPKFLPISVNGTSVCGRGGQHQ